MASLPTGTITFLFTDIEGSTQRWEQHRAAMERALARHDELLRGAPLVHNQRKQLGCPAGTSALGAGRRLFE